MGGLLGRRYQVLGYYHCSSRVAPDVRYSEWHRGISNEGPVWRGGTCFRATFKGSESLKDDDAEAHFPARSAPTFGVQALRSGRTSSVVEKGGCESEPAVPPFNDSDPLKRA
jgi:hypothetical protein